MITYKYFEDIEMVASGIHANYRSHIVDRSPRNYSVEFTASGRMYFQRKPGPRTVLEGPALRWQKPGFTYNYGPIDNRGWEHYFVLFRGDRAERLFDEGFSRLSESIILPVKRADLFRGLFAAIHRALTHVPENAPRAIIHLEQILVHAAEEIKGFDTESPYRDKLDPVCSKIHMNPGAGFDFRGEAESLGISYSHFRRCFREYTGTSPHQYVLKAKLIAAADRISRTDDPLKQIAYELGLGNPAQFSRTFNSHFGIPPGAYRK